MKKQSPVSSVRFIVPQHVRNESSSSFDVKDIFLPKNQLESSTVPPPVAPQSPAADDVMIKEAKKPRRSISFNPNVRCIKIRSCRQMSESQISKTWMNQEDFAKIKQECRQVAYLINADLKVEGMGERGIAHCDKGRVHERRSLRNGLVHEINCMQELQSKLCQNMHERSVFSDIMAANCARLTAISQELAYARANSDAAEADL
jgi:hypothetical protein